MRSIGHISRLQNIPDSDEEFLEPEKMLKILLEDNKACAKRMRSVHKICEKHGDIATASILEVFLDETERRIWFLFETLTAHK